MVILSSLLSSSQSSGCDWSMCVTLPPFTYHWQELMFGKGWHKLGYETNCTSACISDSVCHTLIGYVMNHRIYGFFFFSIQLQNFTGESNTVTWSYPLWNFHDLITPKRRIDDPIFRPGHLKYGS